MFTMKPALRSRTMDARGGNPSFYSALVGAIALLLAGGTVWAQCSKYELIADGGLQKGQSISVLPFILLDLSSSVGGDRQWLEQEDSKLQQVFGQRLSEELKKTGVFSNVRRLPPNTKIDTTRVIDGSRLEMVDVSGGVRVWLSAVVKRASGMNEVLRLTECSTVIEMNVGTSFIRTTPEILGPFLGNLALEIAKTVAEAAGKPAVKGQKGIIYDLPEKNN